MKTAMLGMLAETPIHPGAGRSMGVVDLPVAREVTTDYPVLVGSSLKGSLRDKAESMSKEKTSSLDPDKCFGRPDHAGELMVSDARLLLLPVRSLTQSFRWTTCPHLIERYRRDLARAGLAPLPEIAEVKQGSALMANGSGPLFLEERRFEVSGTPNDGLNALAEAIAPLVLHEDTRNRLVARLAVLNDDDFAWFARYGLAIQARNVLEDGTKRSRNLWYEETLPPDTVMYALVGGRTARALSALQVLLPEEHPYLQTGGNETTGQGWFAVTVHIGKLRFPASGGDGGGVA